MIKRPLPESTGRLKRRTTAFCGLDRRPGAPFGAVKDGIGFVSTDGVTLQGSPTWERVYTFPQEAFPQSTVAVSGGLFSVCRSMELVGGEYMSTEAMCVAFYDEEGGDFLSEPIIMNQEVTDGVSVPSDFNGGRSMVQFNVYSEEGKLSDAIGGTYDKKLLIFPDKMSVDLPVTKDGFTIGRMEEVKNTVPDLKHVTVSGGRLFGVDEGRIYASAYNDPWNWDVDTPYDIGAENAWVTTTGADTRGDGAFTAIVAHDGRVWCLKKDFGHIVSGESNPFSVKDTDVIGAVEERAVARGDGRLFFVRSDGVRMAQGSSVTVISAPLCLSSFTEAICAYRDGVLYIAEGDSLYLYSHKNDCWSVSALPDTGEVISLCATERGLYATVSKSDSENYIYRLSGGADEWSFSLHGTDLSVDTDKGPATLTIHGDAEEGTVISAELYEQTTGKTVPLGQVTGDGGRLRLRRHIRGGAGQSFIITVRVKGQAVIRALTLTARSGVKDDG